MQQNTSCYRIRNSQKRLFKSIVAHSRLISLFAKPKIKANDKINLRQFHQQLKCINSWLLSMGYKSPIFSSENLTKEIHRLPLHLRNQFYKLAKDSSLMDGSVNVLISGKWLCWLCGNNRRFKGCKRFISKWVSDGKQIMKDHKPCWNRLCKKHTIKECKSTFSCSEDSCNKQHHTLIHEDVKVKQEENVTTNHVSQYED